MKTEDMREKRVEETVRAFQYPNKNEWNDRRIRKEIFRLLPWKHDPVLTVAEENDIYETHSGEPVYAPISREILVTYVVIDCGEGKTARVQVRDEYGAEL